MPIYEYTCQSCGHHFSFLHKRLDEPKPPCPQCQSTDIRKQISSFSARAASHSCESADYCPGAAHSCCPGCCHHHH